MVQLIFSMVIEQKNQIEFIKTIQEIIIEMNNNQFAMNYYLYQNINDKSKIEFIQEADSLHTFNKYVKSNYFHILSGSLDHLLSKKPDVRMRYLSNE
jgi:quinol monooxygenase YgiN